MIPKKTLMTTGCKPTSQVIILTGRRGGGGGIFNGNSKSFSLSLDYNAEGLVS